jgi:hypothetical protein
MMIVFFRPKCSERRELLSCAGGNFRILEGWKLSTYAEHLIYP